MKKKIKSALFVTLTLALVSAAAVAVTWAANVVYQKAQLGEKTNTFTSTKNIALALTEPNWFGEATTYTGNNSYYGWDNGTDTVKKADVLTTSKATGDNGSTLATSYTEGQTNIPKDPRLTNVGDTSETEFVAMKVVFSVADSSGTQKSYPEYNDFATCIATVKTGTSNGITGNDWSQDTTNKQLYFYASPLLKLHQTKNIFDTVNINTATAVSTLAEAYKSKTAAEIVTAYNEGDDTAKEAIGKTLLKDAAGAYSWAYYDGSEWKRASGSKLPEFKIELTGYAVEAKSFGDTIATSIPDDAKTALRSLASGS